MRRASVSTFLFAASIAFFSLSAFSVRAAACAYFLIGALAFLKMPTLLARQIGLAPVLAYWATILCLSFIQSAFGDFYPNYFIKFIFIQTYIALMFWMFRSKILTLGSLTRACEILIYVHAAFFIFQLTYYLLTGHFIDFDSYVREGSAEALYETKTLSDSLIPIRALGLFSEPSFYAMTVVPAGIVLLLAKRQLTFATCLAFFTALLSFSVAAIIVCAMLCIVHLFLGRVSVRLKIATILVAVLCTPPLYTVYDRRVNQSEDYNAVASRTLVFNELAVRDSVSGMFGNGLFWDERNNVGKTHLRGYEVRDSSFYVYMIFSAGAVGATVFFGSLLALFNGHGRRRYLLYLLPILLFKYHFLHGMLWLTLLLFLVVSREIPMGRHPGRRKRFYLGSLGSLAQIRCRQ